MNNVQKLIKILNDPFLIYSLRKELESRKDSINPDKAIDESMYYTIRDSATDQALRDSNRTPIKEAVKEHNQKKVDSMTTDRSDPDLHETLPNGQNKKYLILSDEERAKGFIRPYRDSYVHIGPPGPKYPLRDLNTDEYGMASDGYVKYEEIPEADRTGITTGYYWTQAQLDAAGKGCGTRTIMGRKLSETYAVNPKFYGATFCCGCGKHLPVKEFVWDGTTDRVGS